MRTHCPRNASGIAFALCVVSQSNFRTPKSFAVPPKSNGGRTRAAFTSSALIVSSLPSASSALRSKPRISSDWLPFAELLRAGAQRAHTLTHATGAAWLRSGRSLLALAAQLRTPHRLRHADVFGTHRHIERRPAREAHLNACGVARHFAPSCERRD